MVVVGDGGKKQEEVGEEGGGRIGGGDGDWYPWLLQPCPAGAGRL